VEPGIKITPFQLIIQADLDQMKKELEAFRTGMEAIEKEVKYHYSNEDDDLDFRLLEMKVFISIFFSIPNFQFLLSNIYCVYFFDFLII